MSFCNDVRSEDQVTASDNSCWPLNGAGPLPGLSARLETRQNEITTYLTIVIIMIVMTMIVAMIIVKIITERVGYHWQPTDTNHTSRTRAVRRRYQHTAVTTLLIDDRRTIGIGRERRL